MKAIFIARVLEEKPLTEITGSNCSLCACRYGGEHPTHPLTDFPETHACYTRGKETLEKISEASGMDVRDFIKDPWGSPYLLDENEAENSTYCRRDWILSAGPDQIFGNTDDIMLENIISYYDNEQCGL